MSDELEQIVVLRGHLEEWQEALSWAHSHFSAVDLADNYRSLKRTYTPSRLTTLLERSLVRATGYLESDEENVIEQ